MSMNEKLQSRGYSRRAFVALACSSLIALPLAAQAATPAATNKTSGKTRTVIDCSGREVEIPLEVQTVVCLHPMATQIAYCLVGDEGLLAVDSVFKNIYIGEDVTPYYTEEQNETLSALPVTTVWMKGADEEQLLYLDPDIIFTLTQDPNADQLQKDLGIPVISLFKSPTSSVSESFRVAGEALNRQEKAEEMAEWWESTSERIADDIVEIAEEDRPTVMYVGKSGDLMAVPGKDSVYGTDIAESGCISVSDEIEDTTSEATDVTMEQMLLWDPDFIVCQTASEYETIMTDPEWSALRAVEEGNVLVPLQLCGFDGWFSVLGTDWLNATVLHAGEEEAEEQLRQDMLDYYKIFYDRELTDEELEEIATTW